VAGAVGFLPYYFANQQLELNKRVLAQPKFKLQVDYQVAEAFSKDLTAAVTKLASMEFENKDPKATAEFADETIQIAQKLLKIANNMQISANSLLNESVSAVAIDIAPENDTVIDEPLAMGVGAGEQLLDVNPTEMLGHVESFTKQANAAIDSAKRLGGTVPQEEPTPPEITTTGNVVSIATTGLSQAARVFTGIASKLHVFTGGSRRDVAAASAALETITGVNNYDYMVPKTRKTLGGYGLFQRRKPIPPQQPMVSADASFVPPTTPGNPGAGGK
jgi:hypothetical protein